MHILILPVSYPRFYKPMSGVFFRDQAKALKNSDVQVGVIDPAPRGLRTVGRGGLLANRFHITTTFDDGLPLVRANDWCLPYARRIYARQFVWRTLSLFEHYTRRFGRPDVIHAHDLLWAGVAARAVGAKSGIPYVVTEHSGAYALTGIEQWHRPYLEMGIKDARIVMAVSRDLKERISPYADGRTLRVMPNVVDTDFFSLSTKRSRADHFLFASVASLIIDKRIDILLQAFSIAFGGNHKVCLEIGGDGADRSRLKKLAATLGIADQVRWLGALTRQQVKDCLQRADALVNVSRYETFGVVLIEAMAAGLPVISTRCGGPEDFVQQENGYLVDVNHIDQTAEAMRKLHLERDQWKRKAPLIRQFVVERFGQNVIAKRLLDVYSEAADELSQLKDFPSDGQPPTALDSFSLGKHKV